jgi:hypothetical protein
MKYLLIDFGASFVKCAIFTEDTITPTQNYVSPFTNSNSITKSELYTLLTQIISEHECVDGIVPCTILGGKWEGDVYKSWKDSCLNGKGANCMISGIFNSHVVHSDHKDFTNAIEYTDELKIIGKINEVPVYTPLGDTDCAIRSVNLPSNGAIINMGTGSQVVFANNIKRYFPSGRAFLVFNKLFEHSNISIFDVMNQLTLKDLQKSTLNIDLNVFPQSRNWKSGGMIQGIDEDTFTIKNLVASLMRTFINQYHDYVKDAKSITLIGGIVSKIKLLPDFFKYYYSDKMIISNNDDIEATHKGLSGIIKKHLIV